MTHRQDPSRREFLAASAVGLLGVACRSTAPAQRGTQSRDAELLYVGTYTEGDPADGIHLLHFDTRTGAVRRIGGMDAGPNPSFLAIHPTGHTLYAVNEVTERDGKPAGGVRAFDIASDTGQLTPLNEQSSEGGAPCYVSVDRAGRAALVANYVGGSVAVLPIFSDGTLGNASQVVQHVGSGPDAPRQNAPHAHCIVTDPSNRFALAADLGVDRVLVYHRGADGLSLLHARGADAALRPGAGPRHLAFHPTLSLVFVVNELDSTISTFRFDSDRGVFSPMDVRSTLPAGWTGTNYPADIHVAPSGRQLYVSNRGHNSIAMFALAGDTLAPALEQVVSTEGEWPRNFSLDPTGGWLLVGNQRSGSVVVFRRDQDTGRLTPTQHRIAIARPACLRFRSP